MLFSRRAWSAFADNLSAFRLGLSAGIGEGGLPKYG